MAAEAEHPPEDFLKATHLEAHLHLVAVIVEGCHLLCRVPAPLLGQARRVVPELKPDDMARVGAGDIPDPERPVEVGRPVEILRLSVRFA